MLVLSSVLRKF